MKNYLLKPNKRKEEKEKEKERIFDIQEKRKSVKSAEKKLIKNYKNSDIKNIIPKINKEKNLIKEAIISPKTIDYSQCT